MCRGIRGDSGGLAGGAAASKEGLQRSWILRLCWPAVLLPGLGPPAQQALGDTLRPFLHNPHDICRPR